MVLANDKVAASITMDNRANIFFITVFSPLNFKTHDGRGAYLTYRFRFRFYPYRRLVEATALRSTAYSAINRSLPTNQDPPI
jgi:hypothetical protein